MAEAAYAAGPTLLVAPRPLSSIFSKFLVSCFSAGPMQIVRQCGGGGQRVQIPRNLKSEAPKSGPQTGFLGFSPPFQCFRAGLKQSASAWPQRAQVHQNFKSEAAKSGASNVFPLFQYFSAGPQRAQGPQKDVRPQNLKM